MTVYFSFFPLTWGFVTRASSKVTLSYSPIVLFTLNSICCRLSCYFSERRIHFRRLGDRDSCYV